SQEPSQEEPPQQEQIPTLDDYRAADEKIDPKPAAQREEEHSAEVEAKAKEVRAMIEAEESGAAPATVYSGKKLTDRMQRVTEEVHEEGEYFLNLNNWLGQIDFKAVVGDVSRAKGKSEREAAIITAVLSRYEEDGHEVPPIYKEDVLDLVLAHYKKFQTKSSQTSLAERKEQADFYQKQAEEIVKKHAA